MTDPYPVVSVGGVVVARGGAADQVLVQSLDVPWGREDITQHAATGTASVVLFDRTGRWATSLDRDLLGLSLRIAWTSTGGDGADYFRGRITFAEVLPWTTGGDDGALIRLTASSLLLDLANLTPAGAWPAETVTARLGRIVTASAGVLAGADIPALYSSEQVLPVDATAQTSLLEHLTRVYDSFGMNRMVWNPATSRAGYVPRLTGWSARTLGELYRPGTGGAGAFIRAAARFDPSSSTVYPAGCYLPAAALHRAAARVSRDIAGRVSRVLFTRYVLNGTTGKYETVVETASVLGADPATEGNREASVETVLSGGANWTTAFQDWIIGLGQEGRGWRPAPCTYRPAATGGFEDPAVRDALLAGYETPAVFFLQRSLLADRLGLRPVYALIGGTISYAAGEWAFQLAFAPVHTATPQHAVTWPEIDDGSTANRLRIYTDGLDHDDALHPSVTCTDLAYVGTGLGSAVPGPDTGWDVKQQ